VFLKCHSYREDFVQDSPSSEWRADEISQCGDHFFVESFCSP
jgi:hypothetical protein